MTTQQTNSSIKPFLLLYCLIISANVLAKPAVATIPIRGGNTWAVAKGAPEAWWGPTASTVSANYTTYPNQLDEQTVEVESNSGTHQWAYPTSYDGAGFSITRQKRWHKNGGRLKGQDVDHPDSYKWFLTITFSTPVPANEMYIFLYDMDQRGTSTAYGPSASIKFGDSDAGPSDFEALSVVSVPGVDNPMNQMAYGTGGGITFSGITGSSDRNAYVALAGKSTKTVKTIEVEMRNIGDDVGFELGWLNINRDFGDAPNSYGTKDASSGASHYVDPKLYLGSLLDTDGDGQSDDAADGDDTDANGDDENGIILMGMSNAEPPKIANTKKSGTEVINSYSFDVKVTNKFSVPATLVAWLDWNRNGVFESGEASGVVTVAANSDNVTKTIGWDKRTLNLDNFKAYTYLRIRLSTDPLLTTSKPTGIMQDGEIEDYKVPLQDSALPVTLVSFNGRETEPGAVHLTWETTYESDSRDFEIQRSTNAKQFEKIGSVVARNEGMAANTYEFDDRLPGLNKNVIDYRLRSVDLDESFSYSTIVAVKLSKEAVGGFTIWPMPAAAGSDITLSGNVPVSSLTLYDLQGRVISQDARHVYSDGKLTLAGLGAGTYLLRVNENQTLKLLIK